MISLNNMCVLKINWDECIRIGIDIHSKSDVINISFSCFAVSVSKVLDKIFHFDNDTHFQSNAKVEADEEDVGKTSKQSWSLHGFECRLLTAMIKRNTKSIP